eukprot:scaffold87_cov388-Prasinococcus_capsulatus_cf.AAC.17
MAVQALKLARTGAASYLHRPRRQGWIHNLAESPPDLQDSVAGGDWLYSYQSLDGTGPSRGSKFMCPGPHPVQIPPGSPQPHHNTSPASTLIKTTP